MASCLLKSECVDLANQLYKMTFWATAINQITAPSGMNIAGGSVAVITNSNGVENYYYNSSTSSWKKDTRLSSVDSKVDSIEDDVGVLKTKVFNVVAYAGGVTSYDIPIGELTHQTGSCYLILLKFFGSATTFYYDLCAVSFNENTPIFNYISRNTNTISVTGVSYEDGVLTLTFNTSAYLTAYYAVLY